MLNYQIKTPQGSLIQRRFVNPETETVADQGAQHGGKGGATRQVNIFQQLKDDCQQAGYPEGGRVTAHIAGEGLGGALEVTAENAQVLGEWLLATARGALQPAGR